MSGSRGTKRRSVSPDEETQHSISSESEERMPLTSAHETVHAAHTKEQSRRLNFGTTNESGVPHIRQPQPLRDPQSHRQIEKRRRDRMNNCLAELLEQLPKPEADPQRRVEKAEIIEMASTYIRQLNQKFNDFRREMETHDTDPQTTRASKSIAETQTSIDMALNSSTASMTPPLLADNEIYRCGYNDSMEDTMNFVLASHGDTTLITLQGHFQSKREELRDNAELPLTKKQRHMKRNIRRSSPKCVDLLTSEDEPIDNNQEKHLSSSSYAPNQPNAKPNGLSSPAPRSPSVHPLRYQEQEQQLHETLGPVSLANATAPIFCLHPAGTHYVPMVIDASLIAHAFQDKAMQDPLRCPPICHPISIPVNFNPVGGGSSFADPYDVEIQNINVVGSRLETSVRPTM